MGFFGSILKAGLPILGGVLGGPVGAAIGGGLSGLIGGHDKAKQQTQSATQAGQTAMGGFNYLQGSPIGQQYLPAGGAANAQQASLLGIGPGGTATAGGSNPAYQNYLNSVGYQGQIKAGQQSITGSAAARGLLGSGSTAKALQANGQQIASQNFNNYLGQLGGVAQQGLQAGGMLGNAATQGSSQAAGMQFGAGQQAAESKSSGWDQLLGGLGTAYDAYAAGKGAKTSTASTAAPKFGVAPIAPISTSPVGRGAQPILRR